MYKKITMLLAILSLFVANISFGMNLTRPYDSLVRAERKDDCTFQLKLLGQGSFSCAKGFDEDGCKVNILRIWNEDQNALKMLDGFDPATAIGQTRVHVSANDDGARGHFLVDGDLSAHGLAFSSRWCLPQNFSFVAHIPFYFMNMKNVAWSEQTQEVTADDYRTKQYLTDDFFANVRELGDGLELGGWRRYGIGDISLLLEWLRDFPQAKPFLKNVRLNARAGINVPTGKRRDEDKLFALPFGGDGATGVTFGAGIDLTFRSYLRAGVDVSLQHLFGNTKCRRVKTHEDQTELLLLGKTNAFKDFGLSQQFSLYAQGYRLFEGFSCTLGYQFFRHGDDTLSLFDHEFSQEIANTAKSLQEWTMHNAFFSLSYDFGSDDESDSKYHPYISVFVKVPFNGRSSALVNTVGAVLSVNF